MERASTPLSQPRTSHGIALATIGCASADVFPAALAAAGSDVRMPIAGVRAVSPARPPGLPSPGRNTDPNVTSPRRRRPVASRGRSVIIVAAVATAVISIRVNAPHEKA